jgi:hypothetical protein
MDGLVIEAPDLSNVHPASLRASVGSHQGESQGSARSKNRSMILKIESPIAGTQNISSLDMPPCSGLNLQKIGRKAMRRTTFASGLAFALVAGTAMAQTAAPSASQSQPGSNSPRAGKPADLCAELLAFVHPPAPAPGSAAAPAGAAASASSQSQAAAQPPANAATAVTAPAQKEAAPQPSSSGGAPQQSSSLSGQVTPSGPGASGPQGTAQPGAGGPPPATTDAAKPSAPQPAPQQAAAAPAPAAPAAPPPKKPSAEQIDKVEAAAREHNLQGCRDVAQEMRKAGVVMPPPLLALAALDPKFFDTNQKQ